MMKSKSNLLLVFGLIVMLILTQSCEKKRLESLQQSLNNGMLPCELIEDSNYKDEADLLGLYYENGLIISVDGTTEQCSTVIVASGTTEGTWGCLDTLLNDGSIANTDGAALTQLMIDADCQDTEGSNAAQAVKYLGAIYGFEDADVFIPSTSTLNNLYTKVVSKEKITFFDTEGDNWYWTSNEIDKNNAVAFNMNTGETKTFNKDLIIKILALASIEN